MEDPNTLAADCIVISCCCQCLVLQIVVLLLLKLPWRLVRKTREFAKRRRRRRRRGKEEMVDYRRDDDGGDGDGDGDGDGRRCMRRNGGDGLSCCMEEIEKVMEDLHHKGEFGFGSFCRDEKRCNARFVRYQFIQEFHGIT